MNFKKCFIGYKGRKKYPDNAPVVATGNVSNITYATYTGGGSSDTGSTGTTTDAYTKSETNALLAQKQDTLVSGENIATINGKSLLEGGNVLIDTSVDLSNYYTKEESDEKYQPVGEYLTAIPAEYITESELNAKGYISAIPDEYVTEDELNTKLGGYYDETAMDRLLDLKANISNLKTINNIPIYRSSYGESGNIDISAGGLEITPVTSAIFEQVSAYPISNVDIGDIPVAKIDDGVEPFYISAIDREYYKINLYKQPAHDDSNKWPITGLPQNLIIRFENYDKRLWDNPHYRICLMEWKRDNDKCWHWSIPMITPRWDTYTGEILHYATPSRYAFNETYTVIAPFDGQNAQTKMFGAITGKNWTQILNLQTKHEQRADGTMRWRFKNGHSNKLFGFAIFKFFPNKNMAGFIGQYKWARVSNIVKLRLTVDKNGYVRARVLP